MTTINDGQLTKFLKLLSEKKMTPEALQIALENGTFADFLEFVAVGRTIDRNGLRKTLGLPRLDDQLKRLIGMGDYDKVHPDMTPLNFPVEMIPPLVREGLTRLRPGVSLESATSYLDGEGHRSATLAELLVYGYRNGRKCLVNGPAEIIAAIGTQAVIGGKTMVGVLIYESNRLSISVCDVDTVMNGLNIRLLVVPK